MRPWHFKIKANSIKCRPVACLACVILMSGQGVRRARAQLSYHSFAFIYLSKTEQTEKKELLLFGHRMPWKATAHTAVQIRTKTNLDVNLWTCWLTIIIVKVCMMCFFNCTLWTETLLTKFTEILLKCKFFTFITLIFISSWVVQILAGFSS